MFCRHVTRRRWAPGAMNLGLVSVWHLSGKRQLTSIKEINGDITTYGIGPSIQQYVQCVGSDTCDTEYKTHR